MFAWMWAEPTGETGAVVAPRPVQPEGGGLLCPVVPG